jgi:HK97 family phage major capsid protein
MSEFLKAQIEARQNIWSQAKEVLERAENENRSLTAEETETYNRMSSDLDARAALIETAKKDADREARAAEAAANFTPAVAAQVKSDEERIRAMARGEIRSFDFGMESRAGLTPGTTGAPVPTSFYSDIILKAQYVGPMLTTSTILRTGGGEPLQIPSLSAYSTAAVTAAGSVLAENDPTFNSFVTLQAWKQGGLVTVARELLEDTSVDLLGFLSEQIGVGLGTALNQKFTLGTGTVEPTGLVTSAGSALTGGTGVSGAFTADNLIALVYSLNTAARRRPGAGFQMNSKSIAAVRSLKDNYGRYIFDPSLSADKNDLLLGYPIYENPDMADPAIGAKSVVFGDLKSYYLREVQPGIRLDRSDDYAFANDQVTFRYTYRGDGALVQPTHVKFFKGGAS